MITISAVICTYKRTNYLREALRSLSEQTLDRSQFEVLVVDNAVEDGTKDVVNEFQSAGLNVRYVPENEVGLNRARNTGLKSAVGQYLAYIDDDARADTRWLEALVHAFRTTNAAVIGGRVWLDWRGEKPTWVPDRLLPFFTYVDHGERAHALRATEYLVGANLAFQKDALKSIGGFDPRLDRQGPVLLSGGDTKTVELLRGSGNAAWYEPAAVVWHSVLPSRKRPRWLFSRLFWDGASQPLVDGTLKDRSKRAIVRGVVFDLGQCLRWLLIAVVAAVTGRTSSAWESMLGFSQRAGRVRTQLRMLALDPN